MKGKLSSFAICLLLIFALFAANHVLFQNSEENIPVVNQEVTDKEINKPDSRNTRSPPGWMDEMRLTSSSGDSTRPDMAVWGSNLHVVWRDNSYDIYYKRSVDNGLSWGDNILLTSAGVDYYGPRIAVSGNNIHVVWDSDGVTYYMNSTDNGDNWGIITAWDWSSYPFCLSGDWVVNPDVTVDGNYVYIVTYAMGVEHLIFKRSSDNGNSWTDWIFVTDSTVWCADPMIDNDGSLIHIVYNIDVGSSESLLHYLSDDQGDTWYDDWYNPFVDLDETIESLVSFSISMHGDNLYVVYSLWDVNLGTCQIKYTRWDDSPDIWYGPYIVSEDAGGDVDIDGNHIVWNQKDGDSNAQIFSNKYGQATNYPSDSSMPSIAIMGDITHIVWVDDRDGNNELYYTQRGLLPDLTLSKSNIQFTPASPVVNGTSITIDATIFSYSKSSSNVEVKFYNGDPDTDDDFIPDLSAEEIGIDTININKDASAIASIQWTPPSEGTYNIYVWVNPNNIIQEYNYRNNLANKTLAIIPDIFSMNLVESWNLISIPLELSDKNLTSVLQPIEEQYDIVRYYNASDTEDSWKCYHKLKPTHMNDLDSIDYSNGFWLHITEPGGTTLTIIDNKLISSHQINLYKGWNLVGYPSNTKFNRTDGLNNLDFGSDINAIYWYNASSTTWVNMGENDYFEPGRGYWFHSKVITTWSVPL